MTGPPAAPPAPDTVSRFGALQNVPTRTLQK
jgi:hypothetical protein